MDIISRGFPGRRSAADPKLPAGQYLTTDFPVLSAAGQTELREVTKTPLERVGRAALALIGKFPSEEVSSNLHRLKEVMETGRVGVKQ